MNTPEQSIYDKYSLEFSQKFNKVWVRTDKIKQAFSYFTEIENLRVLEVWCGNWKDAKEILRYSSHYIGLDYSEGMLKLAREYLPEAEFILEDIEEYETQEKFDIIFSFASLVHLPKDNMKKILSKIYWMLNGWWILMLLLRYGPEYTEEIISDEFGERFFTLYNWEVIKSIIDWYDVDYEEVSEVNKRKWFMMILKK
ncbi:MAG: methyltransferase [uncultured bacterium (gcode 4)]|uniref:Methyltransferase n=1 Tax=uncultured bacterium (gcode 4) TaxID=1234023 RepID=K2GWZ0_9BACT|nr:MAG: methyltransferase [uncultured bacterium (gcode 4)]